MDNFHAGLIARGFQSAMDADLPHPRRQLLLRIAALMISLALLLILVALAQPAYGQSHGGGRQMGGHGGWHEGGGRGGGGGWWGLGLGLGLGWGIASLVEPYPYGYYAYPGYYEPYRGYYPPYVVEPEPAMPAPIAPRYAPAQAAGPVGSWYYCDSAHGYYPYVAQCPEAWRSVSPVPPGPAR